MQSLPITLYQGVCKHVEFFTYPDGQSNCQLDMEYFNDPKLPITIDCSIRGFPDLERLLCLVGALQRADFVVSSINFVYLFGMRSDRAFHAGQPNYFRDVVAPIINRLPGIHSYYWPHGSISPHYFKDNSELRWSVPKHPILYIDSPFIRIAGDKTAWHETPCAFDGYFVKTRTDANITVGLRDKYGVKIGNPAYNWEKDVINPVTPDTAFLIIDDLCDGGATFIAEGIMLKSLWPERKRYLFVAHGLFTKGFDALLEVFDGIVTTNSYQDFSDLFKDAPASAYETIKVIEVIK